MYEELAYMSDLLDVQTSLIGTNNRVEAVARDISFASGTNATGITAEQDGTVTLHNTSYSNMPLILLGKNSSGKLKRLTYVKLRSSLSNGTYSYHDGVGNNYINRLSCSISGNQYEISFAVHIPEYAGDDPINGCHGVVFPIFPSFQVDMSGFNDYKSNFSKLVGIVKDGNLNSISTSGDQWSNAIAAASLNSNGAINVMVNWRTPVNQTSSERACFVVIRGTVPFKAVSTVSGFSAPSRENSEFWSNVTGWSWNADLSKTSPSTTLESTWSLI